MDPRILCRKARDPEVQRWSGCESEDAYALFQPEVVGGLINRVEVWCWLTAVDADGHDRQLSHDLDRLRRDISKLMDRRRLRKSTLSLRITVREGDRYPSSHSLENERNNNLPVAGIITSKLLLILPVFLHGPV